MTRYERMGEYANDLAMEDAARQWDAQAEAQAPQEDADCLICYSFPNLCSRPTHDCPDRQLRNAR